MHNIPALQLDDGEVMPQAIPYRNGDKTYQKVLHLMQYIDTENPVTVGDTPSFYIADHKVDGGKFHWITSILVTIDISNTLDPAFTKLQAFELALQQHLADSEAKTTFFKREISKLLSIANN